MTNIYFVRHAQADNTIHDDMSRPLTEKGLKDRSLVTAYLEDKHISVIASSPYKRARDTVGEFAAKKGLDIICDERFAERKITDGWAEDFSGFSKRQWEDFDYHLPGGESLNQVQKRNIEGLHGLISGYSGKNIAVGTHGTALSVIYNYFHKGFDYTSFTKIVGLTPWVVHFKFDGERCIEINSVNLFEL